MSDTDDLAATIADSAARLRQACAAELPRVAVLLGSGWGGLAERVIDPVDVPYAELPAFPRLGVGGHAGRVRIGSLGGRRVMVLAGRKHVYEDGDAGDAGVMKGALRTLASLGVQVLVQTNAAGSLDETMGPGALMLLSDHLNLPQRSPLVGERDDRRFVDMSDAYDPALRRQATEAAAAAGVPLHEGVYAWVLGPQFETPAEIRWLQRIGARAVGMSTVPETILARHAGLRVLALSLVTNLAAGLTSERLSHGHTLSAAASSGERAVRVLEAVVAALEP